jgi:GT2 family glycosyltransferase
MEVRPPLLIIIPLYRNAALVSALLGSLARCGDELDRSELSILLINDSPEDDELAQTLERELPILRRHYDVTLHTNAANQGFTLTANFGLEYALRHARDVVLLNSDTLVFPGALREMREVAYLDRMIGFVNPRSNNATIASLPQQSDHLKVPPAHAYAAFEVLSRYLPRRRYVPTAVGFCLYIKLAILREFGIFDPAYGHGYNEENDLIMRANRCGYRAALANKAFIYHIGEQSFALTNLPADEREVASRKILSARYPEYLATVRGYFRSPEYEAELRLTGLLAGLDGRRHLVLDVNNLGAYHTGTSEVATQLIKRIAPTWSDAFHVAVLCSAEAFAFHNLDQVAGLRRVDSDDKTPFAAVIRLGQPFFKETVCDVLRRAPAVLVSMLDAIALDCIHLRTPELYTLWRLTMQHCSVVIYNSLFTQAQFEARFDVPDSVARAVSRHSYAVSDFTPPRRAEPSGKKHLLVVGNHFDHKFVAPTVAKLLERTNDVPIVVLGHKLETSDRVTTYQSGLLSAEQIDELYANAIVFIYPSHYEGFGLPLIHALAHEKPIVARRLPVFGEVIQLMGGTPNIHLADSTDELVELVASGKLEWIAADPPPDQSEMGWDRHSRELRAATERALGSVSYAQLLERFNMLAIFDPPVQTPEVIEEKPAVPPEAPQEEPAKLSDLDIRTELATKHVRRVIRIALQVPGVTTVGQLMIRTARLLKRLGTPR